MSGGHSQLFDVEGVGRYRLLGDTLDDAAGEAFDKTAKLLGLPYPGGPALARLAEAGRDGAVSLPRPMLDSGDLDMSFSGLKTAVLTLVRREAAAGALDDARRADIAREFQHAVVDVLVAKALAALGATGRARLVVAGGVGANRELRARLGARIETRGGRGLLSAARVLHRQRRDDRAGRRAAARGMRRAAADAFSVRPRWDLASLPAVLTSRLSGRSCAPCPSTSCRMLLRCRQNSSAEIGIQVQATGVLPKT